MSGQRKKSSAKNKNPQPQGRGMLFSVMEEEVLNFWDKNKTFEKSVERKAPKGDYVFYDGPPFGTGEPHYGHILSSVTKDVVPRYWTMQGYQVERRWGWDCHGLPIENIIEKDMKISGKKEIEKVGINKFNEACRARVLEYADTWGKMVRRIGRWIEFKNSYKTMDLSYMESVWWAFSELWKKGLIYEGRKVLLYCPRCETPISNFEVAMDNSYKEIKEKSVTVKFKITKKSLMNNQILRRLTPQDDKKGGDIYILAWTTTPWTLPGNVALAVGNKLSYVLVKKNNEQYILAKDRLEVLVNKYEVAKEFKGKDLVGLEYESLFDVPAIKESGKKAYYVADADFVTTEDGTGVVHTAVVYGEDDYNLGLKLYLPVVPAIDEKGYFNETVPQFKGVYFKDADKKVIEDLEKRGLLFTVEDYKHAYPFCHRCETQLFYNAIPAWFLNVQKLKKRMLELNDNINWFPKYLKEGRFVKGIEQAPDWNISRNRYFATPIPIWKCDKCEKMEVIASVKDLEDKSGEKNIKDIHNHKIDHLTWKCQCGGEKKRISEVFDCWVESGSMSFAQMHYPFENKDKFEKNFPAQFISEYISQTRAWFYVMHVMSTALFDRESFQNVIANGVILNEKGDKLSKSKENYPDPWKIIDEFGSDALRFYLMSSSVMQAENLLFNEREVRDVFRKNIMLLWNVYSFYAMYAGDRKQEFKETVVEHVLDKWIIAKLNQLITDVTKAMNNYNLVKATRPIEEFINDLSTWYIRRSRDRFKGGGPASTPTASELRQGKQDKELALETTGFVLLQLSKVIAPFMPFMAEQIWQRVSGNNFEDENKSVHLESWPKSEVRSQKSEVRILEEMEQVRKIVELGLAKRDEAGIKVRQPLSKLTVVSLQLSDEYARLIKDEVNVKAVEFKKGKELFVELDTKLTDELKQEGIKRELVRAINNLRKEAHLTIQDRAAIYYDTKNAEIKEVFKKFSEDIKKDTLSDDIKVGKGEVVKINGEEVELKVEKKVIILII